MRLFSRGRKKDGDPAGPTSKAQEGSNDTGAPVTEEHSGLFLLRDCPPHEKHAVDIVAVHGLGGHWKDTWTGAAEKNWLKDFLPVQLHDGGVAARVMSYGYDSDMAFTKSVTDIHDVAGMLLDRLAGERQSHEEKLRPILFIAHSLGGIVVKRAMILAHERSKYYGEISDHVRAIVFLGVPHRGSDAAYWATFATKLLEFGQLGLRGSSNYVAALQRNSLTFANISTQFVERGAPLSIRTFYETERMGNQVIVDRDSAILNLPNEIAVGVAGSNHRTMCKFDGKDSQKYKPVWQAVRSLAQSALAERLDSATNVERRGVEDTDMANVAPRRGNEPKNVIAPALIEQPAMTVHDYRVGWICAVQPEFVAACQFFDERHPHPSSISPYDDNAYAMGRMGPHNVVVASLPMGKYGLVSAASVAKDMRRSFEKIRFGLMVGIGGGAPSKKHDIRLGDVVVSSPVGRTGGVMHYKFGKNVQGKPFERTGSLNSPPKMLLTALTNIGAAHEANGHRIAEAVADMVAKNRRLEKYRCPGRDQDRLYEATYLHADKSQTCEVVCHTSTPPAILRAERTKEQDNPAVHYGLIASADQLMKDALVRDNMAEQEGVLCFEMEAAGLMDDFPCLVIRGICDYSDTHKNDIWQRYAAATAAAYAKELLCMMPGGEVGKVPPDDRSLGEAGPRKPNFPVFFRRDEHFLDRESNFSQIDDGVSEERPVTLSGIGGVGKSQSTIENAYRFREGNARQHDGNKYNHTTDDSRIPSKYKALQQDLYSTNPPDDLAALQRRLGKRVEGTCEWILDRPEFCNWLSSPDVQLLRLVGEPGIGKSMISSYLVEELKERQKTENALFAYYFFDNKDESRRTALLFLRTLLLQLLRQEPALFQFIEPDYQQMGQKLMESFDALWRILTTMLDHLQARYVWVLIDAIDECDQVDRTTLLQSLRNWITQTSPEKISKFKCLLTCRPETEIQDLLHGVGQDLEIDRGIVNKDLKQFIEIRVDEISSLRPKWNAQKIKDTLNLKMGGTFLWVALVLKELMVRGKTITMKQVQKKLEDMPTDLRKTYDRILSNIDEEYVEDAIKLLQCVVTASRPLRIAEVTEAYAFMLPKWPQTLTDLEETAIDLADSHRICGCLFFIDAQDNTVNLIHQSAKDYLLSSYLHQHQELARYSVVEETANLLMFESCWRCLSLSDLDGFATNVSSAWEYGQDFSGAVNFASIQFLNYAAAQWVDHALAAARAIQESYVWRSSCLSKRPLLRDRWLREVSAHGHAAVVRLLLEKGAEVDAKDKWGRMALHWAASSGHEAVVKLLLDHKADVDAKDEDGWTALHWAAFRGHQLVVQLLLENRAALEAVDKTRMTALMLAAQNGQVSTIDVLLTNGADIEAEDKYGTSLIRASKGGHEVAVVFLLERGAKSSALDHICGKTALHWAAERGHEDISKHLVSDGRFLDVPDAFGETALHYAAGNGHEIVVEALLEKRPNVMLRDKKGRTPRAYAEQNGHTSVAQMLKEYNGDVLDLDPTETGGRAALIEAARRGHETTVRQLVEKGVNLEAKDEYGRTALMGAASGGYMMTVELLIEKEAEIETKDNYGKTALMYAASGHMAVLQLLLDNEADVRATDDDGQTALHWAARFGHETIVRLLLDRGAILDATSRDGTALSWAANGGYDAVVKLLLEHHANLEMKGGGGFGGGTPLSLAAAWGHVSTVLQLLESGADINAKGEYGQTALERARAGGHKATVKVLEGWSEHQRA